MTAKPAPTNEELAKQLRVIGKYFLERGQDQYSDAVMNAAARLSEPKTVHTDHPLRHWNRTCPACVANGIEGTLTGSYIPPSRTESSPPDPYADVPMGPIGASDFPLASPDPAASLLAKMKPLPCAICGEPNTLEHHATHEADPAAPTPEVDAAERRYSMDGEDTLFVPSDFARTLERQREDAQEKYLLLTTQHSRLCDQVYEDDGETLKQDALRERLVEADERYEHAIKLAHAWQESYVEAGNRAESTEAAHKAMSETAANMCLEIARRDDLLVKEKQARERAQKALRSLREWIDAALAQDAP